MWKHTWCSATVCFAAHSQCLSLLLLSVLSWWTQSISLRSPAVVKKRELFEQVVRDVADTMKNGHKHSQLNELVDK